jgi:signal transduction histidine kinase
MSQKKRTAKEIEEFLTQFSSKISTRLSAIQIIKLSEDHIKETREEIERIKGKIKETLLLIKAQRKVVAELAKKNQHQSLLSLSFPPLQSFPPA